ncbi:hypothetical protein HAX54_006237 [Datura stramonium]|uniref:Protein kinase domain-containing protein n=1 Tax=Datura stramonium TaxID=4076 RepID=A0ABS8T9Y9_DATST|nr:hypothetical protein [Datura stramonium]
MLPEMIGVSADGTGQVGTYFYTAPEIEQRWPKINEKADMYSLGVVFFELWHPFDTAMERHIASLLWRLMSPSPSDRPSAVELLQNAFPPRMEYEMLDNILRTIHYSDDTGVYDKIVNAIFNEDTLDTKGHNTNLESLKVDGRDTSCILFTDLQTDSRDHVVEIATEVFKRHCAKHLEIIPVRMLGECPQTNSRERNAVKLLTHGGDMVELCHELRLPLVKWIIANRATMDIILQYFHPESCDIHLNHADLLDAIWAWAGIRPEHRQKVAELLSLWVQVSSLNLRKKDEMGGDKATTSTGPSDLSKFQFYENCLIHMNSQLSALKPRYARRSGKARTIGSIELNLAETAVNRLQTVGLRFCGVADQALPSIRSLPPVWSTRPTRLCRMPLCHQLRVTTGTCFSSGRKKQRKKLVNRGRKKLRKKKKEKDREVAGKEENAAGKQRRRSKEKKRAFPGSEEEQRKRKSCSDLSRYSSGVESLFEDLSRWKTRSALLEPSSIARKI